MAAKSKADEKTPPAVFGFGQAEPIPARADIMGFPVGKRCLYLRKGGIAGQEYVRRHGKTAVFQVEEHGFPLGEAV
ncbi:hypothetical protein ACG2K1_00410 [Neisseria sp. 23W00296]|uniref:hypothetical protein n=1 Tax=unclassified Neisseria TaxID=2623750 RepID=UPI00375732B0